MARWPQILSGALGAFNAVTVCWALWGLFTPGDYFANGSAWLIPTLLLALSIGGRLAYAAGPRLRYLVIAFGLVCGAFWLLVPNGWWAVPPPGRSMISAAHGGG